MKAPVTGLLLLLAALAGLVLWIRAQLLVVRHELVLRSSAVRLDPRDGVEDWRRRIARALDAAQPPLEASLILRIDRRNWRLGWPPWVTSASVDFAMPCSLGVDPGPPETWTVGFGDFRLRSPMPRERAVELLLNHATEQLRRNRAELDRLR